MKYDTAVLCFEINILYLLVFTGIVAMDPSAPIFDTNSKGILKLNWGVSFGSQIIEIFQSNKL